MFGYQMDKLDKAIEDEEILINLDWKPIYWNEIYVKYLLLLPKEEYDCSMNNGLSKHLMELCGAIQINLIYLQFMSAYIIYLLFYSL